MGPKNSPSGAAAAAESVRWSADGIDHLCHETRAEIETTCLLPRNSSSSSSSFSQNAWLLFFSSRRTRSTTTTSRSKREVHDRVDHVPVRLPQGADRRFGVAPDLRDEGQDIRGIQPRRDGVALHSKWVGTRSGHDHRRLLSAKHQVRKRGEVAVTQGVHGLENGEGGRRSLWEGSYSVSLEKENQRVGRRGRGYGSWRRGRGGEGGGRHAEK